MESERSIEAKVQDLLSLQNYFFVVPDYQREYVWEADDQVEQLLDDLESKFLGGDVAQDSYYIGSIIIVKNKISYDVIDGQQRLTTIVLLLCVIREILQNLPETSRQSEYITLIRGWLSKYNVKTEKKTDRLVLQYDESTDFLSNLIKQEYQSHHAPTNATKKMEQAFNRIKANLTHQYLIKNNEEVLSDKANGKDLCDFTQYLLTKVELVVITSDNLNDAFEIFETSNQRGVGLSVMDLFKNLLFSHAGDTEFQQIKTLWKKTNSHLEECMEEVNHSRFLRYFLEARYFNGILREEKVFKWIVSNEGKLALRYDKNPLAVVKELSRSAERYAALVNATIHQDAGGSYPGVTAVSFINKRKSRQHLVPLLALHENIEEKLIDRLAWELESFFFFSNTLGIGSNQNERLLSRWAQPLRKVENALDLSAVISDTLYPYIKEKLPDFKQKFSHLSLNQYSPGYRQRYVLGRIEDTLRKQAGQSEFAVVGSIQNLQIEHILPRTPKDENSLPSEFSNREDYDNSVNMLGNVTLLESTINQAVNRCNDLSSNWFEEKQNEYWKSAVLTTCFLNSEYKIGNDTQVNRVKDKHTYYFDNWGKLAIKRRQEVLLELALNTWLINGVRLDET